MFDDGINTAFRTPELEDMKSTLDKEFFNDQIEQARELKDKGLVYAMKCVKAIIHEEEPPAYEAERFNQGRTAELSPEANQNRTQIIDGIVKILSDYEGKPGCTSSVNAAAYALLVCKHHLAGSPLKTVFNSWGLCHLNDVGTN